MDLPFDDALLAAHAANDKLGDFVRRLSRGLVPAEGWAEIPVPRTETDDVLDMAVRSWVEVEQHGLAQVAFAFRASAGLYEQLIGKDDLRTLIELGMLHRLVNGNLHPMNIELMLRTLEWGEMIELSRTAWSERRAHFETLSLGGP